MAAMLQSWFMNLSPYGAGAATALMLGLAPLPRSVMRIIDVVPPLVWYAGAGYVVSAPGQDQGAAMAKSLAGGLGTSYLMSLALAPS